jgi:hypothetical protein
MPAAHNHLDQKRKTGYHKHKKRPSIAATTWGWPTSKEST